MTSGAPETHEELGVYQPPPRGWTRALRSTSVVLLMLVSGAVFYTHARIYWDWTEDDAFITYRYARNVVDGHGFVFNPGERVEGYSNFTWVLVAAAALRAGIEPESLTKYVGLLAGLLCLPLSWLLARRVRSGIGMVALVAPFYLAVSPFLVQHAVTGLEASFFACLVCGALLMAVGKPPGVLRSTAFVALLLAIALTRPEGPAVAALLLIFRFALATREWAGDDASTAVKREVATFILLFGAYYAWRWTYFDAAFPNTFFAKTRGGLHGVIDGAQYTLDFMRDSGGVLFVALALLPLVLRRAGAAYWTSLAILGFYTAFVVVAGGDWMYHYRFFAHVLPVLAALVTVGLDTILAYPRPGTLQALLVHASVALVVLATLLGVGNTELRVARIVLPAVRSHNYLSQNYEELGMWFLENAPEDATIAVSDVGAVGYFSERRILDMFGLIDPHIARLRGRMHYKADPRYVLSREPDYIVLVSLNDQGAGYSFQRIPDYAMNARPEFHEQYELIRTVPQHWHNEFVLVYQRRDPSESAGGSR